MGGQTTRIMKVDLEKPYQSQEVMYEKDHANDHYPQEGKKTDVYAKRCVSITDDFNYVDLQAFTLDWVTTNLYMVFRGQRRILACYCTNSNKGTMCLSKCAELFGNRVAVSVGGLALDPSRG